MSVAENVEGVLKSKGLRKWTGFIVSVAALILLASLGLLTEIAMWGLVGFNAAFSAGNSMEWIGNALIERARAGALRNDAAPVQPSYPSRMPTIDEVAELQRSLSEADDE